MPMADTRSRALCYFRNLVARIYREVRYLGTTGKYEPLSSFYEICKKKRGFPDRQQGRTWVKPVFDEARQYSQLSDIENAFARRLQDLKLEQIRDAFENGSG